MVWGTSAIWATCLLFFQILLLGIYAHQIASAFRPSLQGKAPLGFLAINCSDYFPNVYWEFQLGLWALLIIALFLDRSSWLQIQSRIY
jgi:hypothetical protein